MVAKNKNKNHTVVGYWTKPWPTGGCYSLEHKLSMAKVSTCCLIRKKSCTNHGKDSSPPPFVQSVRPGGRWDLIATVSSWVLAGGGPRSLYVRHGQHCTYLEVSLARSRAYISQQQHSTAHGQ